MTSRETIEKRAEARECVLNRYFSVEFSPDGLETPFRSRIRDVSGKGLCIMIPRDSRVIQHLKVGDIFEMAYHSDEKPDIPEQLKTEIRHITPGGEGGNSYYFVGLKVLEGRHAFKGPDKMNAVDRLLRVLKGEGVDRPPAVSVTNAITRELMDAVGAVFPKAHHDPVKIMRLGAAAHDICGLESVKVPFDLTVEAGALGAEIDYGSADRLPHITSPPFLPEDIKTDGAYTRRGRMPVIMEAIRLSRVNYGDRVPVVSSIVGPFTLATLLFGFEPVFAWMLKEKDRYRAALEKTCRLCIDYAREQLKAGSHLIQVAEPSASMDIISPEHYKTLVAPYHRDLCHALESPAVLHICGNITGHLEEIGHTGAAGVSFDFKTDIAEARRCLKGKTALFGYVPTSLLREGTPEEVFAFSKECLKQGVDALNAGCAWQLETPIENVKALIRAAKGE